jgi:hypothetical protein
MENFPPKKTFASYNVVPDITLLENGCGQEKNVEVALSKRGRFHKIRENLLVKESIVGDGEARKRYVIAFNPEEAERDRHQREEIVRAVEEQFENLKQLPNEPTTNRHALYERIKCTGNTSVN